jgi:hypothetical protein
MLVAEMGFSHTATWAAEFSMTSSSVSLQPATTWAMILLLARHVCHRPLSSTLWLHGKGLDIQTTKTLD